MHSHKTSKDMTNSGRMLKHLSWNTQEKKHTPMFASKNSLLQQAKIQEKPWRKKNVDLRHSSAHLLCYISNKCKNINLKKSCDNIKQDKCP